MDKRLRLLLYIIYFSGVLPATFFGSNRSNERVWNDSDSNRNSPLFTGSKDDDQSFLLPSKVPEYFTFTDDRSGASLCRDSAEELRRLNCELNNLPGVEFPSSANKFNLRRVKASMNLVALPERGFEGTDEWGTYENKSPQSNISSIQPDESANDKKCSRSNGRLKKPLPFPPLGSTTLVFRNFYGSGRPESFFVAYKN